MPITLRTPFKAAQGQTVFDVPAGASNVVVKKNGSTVAHSLGPSGFLSIPACNLGDDVVIDFDVNYTATRPQWVWDYLGLPNPSNPVVLPTTVKIVAEGDSNTAGLGASSQAMTYVNKAVSMLPTGPTYTISNIATSGISLLTLDQNYASRGGAQYDAAKALNILTIMAGTNTSGTNDDDQFEKYRLLRSYIRKARASGYRVMVLPYIPRDDNPTYQTNVLNPFNQLIRDMWSADLEADGFVDICALPEFDQGADASNLTYYNSDKLHINDAGNEKIRAAIQSQLQALLTGVQTPQLGPMCLSRTDYFNLTFSNGDRTITIPSGFGACYARGINGAKTGKYAWEDFVETMASQHYLGLGNSNGFTSVNNNGDNVGQAAYRYDGTIKVNNVVVITGAPTLATGDIVQHHVDFDARRWWVRRVRGTTFSDWNKDPTANPATGVGGIDISSLGTTNRLWPIVSIRTGADKLTVRYARADLTQPVAAGFKSFDGVVGPFNEGGSTPPEPTLWTPANDTSGLMVSWVDASDASTFTDVGGGVISQFTDKKTGTWTQATSGRRGTRTAANANFNGKPTLECPPGGGYGNATLTLPQNMRMEMASDGGNGFQISLDGTDGGPNGVAGTLPRNAVWACHWNQGQSIGPAGSNASLYYVTGTNVAINYPGDSTITATKGGLAIVAARVGSTGNGTSWGRFYDTAGGAGIFNRVSDYGRTADMAFGEGIILSGDVSTALRQKYEGYLAWKWGLQADLPSDHPYKAAAPTA